VTKRPSIPIPPDDDFARTAVEYSIDGLMVIDGEGVVRFANPAAVLLLAKRTPELVGYHFGVPAIRAPVEIMLPGLDLCYIEMRTTEVTWAGRPASLACLRDITSRKRVEEDTRRQAEELLERNYELTRFNGTAVGRELRMIELKREVNELCLIMGQPPRHRIPKHDKEPEMPIKEGG
jgi:PAS domain-containing protein